jgi:hypothetical protein
MEEFGQHFADDLTQKQAVIDSDRNGEINKFHADLLSE